MLSLRISSSSGVPVYLQLEQQIKQSIASGILVEGEALASTRRLAAELRINPNTVARAYQNLEREGVIRTVPGGGTFVAASGSGLLKAEKVRRLRPLATQLAVEAAQLQFPAEDLYRLLEAAVGELEKPRKQRSGSLRDDKQVEEQ